MNNQNTSNTKTSPAWLRAATNPVSPRTRLGVTEQEFREMGRIGAMYYNRGDLGKARTVFEGLVAMDPASSDAHAALGALLTRTLENDLALEHLDRAIELNDKQIAAYVNRAEVRLRQRQGEAAVVDLKRAIELDPRQKKIRRPIVLARWSWVFTTRSKPRA